MSILIGLKRFAIMSQDVGLQFRRKAMRMSPHDYSSVGAYFVTICTRDREPLFGSLNSSDLILRDSSQQDSYQDLVKLSDLGNAAHQCWHEIPTHFQFVVLDEFIVMPDHIHGILLFQGDVSHCTSQAATQTTHGNCFGPQSGNLGSIIRGFKIGVKIIAKQKNIKFNWQPRFYDRIIRNANELDRVRQYIRENPLRAILRVRQVSR